ncbi:hypothetical protein [Acidithiobacillus ferriphilus]|uniref:hypothetical protein n=1 Tax=Acidithiobacillus ferriphilus TaxID=1689834 RepID=UPI002DBF2B73|nr:hypothetical protein [Acidithiobacillus ferriphilus]MEB8536821.1 hypothetical protein [Acidithiobacillus ferriphilus]
MKSGGMGDGRARTRVKPDTYSDRYEQSFADLAESSSVSDDRQLIAAVLLNAVEQSFEAHECKARRWLSTVYAQALFLLLDISPSAATEHLEKKWHRIDADALTPPPGYIPH